MACSRVTFFFTFSNGTQFGAVFITSLVVFEIEQALGWYRGADKSLARPTPRCIFFVVRIFRLMLVFIYIYI